MRFTSNIHYTFVRIFFACITLIIIIPITFPTTSFGQTGGLPKLAILPIQAEEIDEAIVKQVELYSTLTLQEYAQYFIIERDTVLVKYEKSQFKTKDLFDNAEGSTFGLTLEADFVFLIKLYKTIDKLVINGKIVSVETQQTIGFSSAEAKTADKIESSGRFNVPVLKDKKYIGFVSRAKVFSAYRKLIKDFSSG